MQHTRIRCSESEIARIPPVRNVFMLLRTMESENNSKNIFTGPSMRVGEHRWQENEEISPQALQVKIKGSQNNH